MLFRAVSSRLLLAKHLLGLLDKLLTGELELEGARRKIAVGDGSAQAQASPMMAAPAIVSVRSVSERAVFSNIRVGSGMISTAPIAVK